MTTGAVADSFGIFYPSRPDRRNRYGRAATAQVSADANGQRLPAAHRRGGRQRHAVPIDFPLREVIDHLLQGDARFQAGERCPEAVVGAYAEGQMLADATVDVES